MKGLKQACLAVAASVTVGAAEACSFHGYQAKSTIVDIWIEGSARLASRSVELYPEYAPIYDHVRAHRALWATVSPADRYQYFASLTADPSEQVRSLAFRELDQTEYGVLRTLDFPPLPSLQGGLLKGDPELWPIKALILGLTGAPDALPEIQDGLVAGLRENWPYLGAYATALIEIDPEYGTQFIATQLLQTPLPSVAQERLIEALALQSLSGTQAGQSIARTATGAILQQRPRFAVMIARQYGQRNDWSMANAIRRASSAKPTQNLAETYILSMYMKLAGEASLTADDG